MGVQVREVEIGGFIKRMEVPERRTERRTQSLMSIEFNISWIRS